VVALVLARMSHVPIWLVKDDQMERVLTRWLSSQQMRNRLSRGLALFVVITIVMLVVVLVVLSTQLVTIWLTDW
jgi:type VI protein secretion system component VasF